MEEPIHGMTDEEILRKQLELLAEVSQTAVESSLAPLTTAMVEIYKLFNRPTKMVTFLACFSVICLYFVISLFLYIEYFLLPLHPNVNFVAYKQD